jgi:DNA ligase-associated metallophosphoesterase
MKSILAEAKPLGQTPRMEGHVLTLTGVDLVARPSGALWWPEARLLCVSDLHLAKSERIARHGGSLLPPYETVETLDRLATEIRALNPSRIVCLGDSFDDEAGPGTLSSDDTRTLLALIAGRDWIWIAGNHDPAPFVLPGSHRAELREGPLVFRHEAQKGSARGEVSGHFHPKISLDLGGRRLRRACFLADANRMILPAFGAYTGGLDCGHPVLDGLLGTDTVAVLTGSPSLRVPMTRRTDRRTG